MILGVRAEPSAINWAIVSGSAQCPILEASGTESAPEIYSEAESLAWLGQRVDFIVQSYRPTKVAVRYAERIAKGANKDAAKSRCRVEGVVLAAAGSRNLPVVTGALKTFSAYSASTSLKDELQSDSFRGLDCSKYSDNVREAIAVGASLLPKST